MGLQAVGRAGEQRRIWFETATEAQFDGLMNVHLKGPFFLTQTLLPLLQEGAGIVNLTSKTTRVATTGVAPYATFKGGWLRQGQSAPGAVHVGFVAGSEVMVNAAHAEALSAGATEIHPPGPQHHYDSRYYAAQVRDLRCQCIHRKVVSEFASSGLFGALH